MDALLEYLLLHPLPSRSELSPEGDMDRILSGGGLFPFSGPAVDSRDSPGKRMLPLVDPVSDIASSCSRLYADEPTPRSAVCLNQEGSFEPRACAIWLLDISVSSLVVGSGVAPGDLTALFSAATIDSGRLRALVEPRDVGRCCQDSVPARDGAIAALEDDLELVGAFAGA